MQDLNERQHVTPEGVEGREHDGAHASGLEVVEGAFEQEAAVLASKAGIGSRGVRPSSKLTSNRPSTRALMPRSNT